MNGLKFMTKTDSEHYLIIQMKKGTHKLILSGLIKMWSTAVLSVLENVLVVSHVIGLYEVMIIGLGGWTVSVSLAVGMTSSVRAYS